MKYDNVYMAYNDSTIYLYNNKKHFFLTTKILGTLIKFNYKKYIIQSVCLQKVHKNYFMWRGDIQIYVGRFIGEI